MQSKNLVGPAQFRPPMRQHLPERHHHPPPPTHYTVDSAYKDDMTTAVDPAATKQASVRRLHGRHFGDIRAMLTTMAMGPNSALRAVRMGMLMSQDDFARALRAAGDRAGCPNDANKRLVQRWESGLIVSPRPIYARALEVVTGLPIDSLGFGILMPTARVTEDDRGGHDVESTPIGSMVMPSSPTPAAAHPPRGSYSGVWLSRYEYFSSGRDSAFVGLHYVVILQHGNRLTVRSLPGSSDSPLTMDLTVEGNVTTGTWVEQTATDGYYRGARYHGAIQMLAEPTGRRMVGKWVGFGAEMDVNTGPWELIFQDSSTTKAALDRFNRRPDKGEQSAQ